MTQAIWKTRLIPAPWARWVIYPLLVVAGGYYFGLDYLYAGPTNGFDLSGALVPVEEIEQGGPPRDGIPAIDRPRFISAGNAGFLSDSDRVLGIDRNGIRKAYAVKILNFHEIVNDRFGQEAIVISYCPLCGTGMAFLAAADDSVHSFGVSGLLYNSDVLLYDRETDSLWSQLMKQAITGPLRGQHLQQITLSHTGGDIQDRLAGKKLRIHYDSLNRTGQVFTADGREFPTTISYWFAWLAFHPDSEVYTAPR